ncbi:MAG: type II toxin-antitoxin system antitoxin SocA domain-containing protein ['Conium maculatum' witches'-broom phytoplasma]|nr:type II toxin-antitoxin system antitoxin SocA domain-containing protein ['Conium maculatum' witches'-broom phytoplasma]
MNKNIKNKNENQINVFDVANYIIKNNPNITTHMKLHKMIYYAYAKYLINHYPIPLFPEKIAAWLHGPVINKLYPVFKTFLAQPINILSPKGDINKITPEIKTILDFIIQKYGSFTGGELREKTHQEKPFLEAYQTTHWVKNIITKKNIYDYFKDKDDLKDEIS